MKSRISNSITVNQYLAFTDLPENSTFQSAYDVWAVCYLNASLARTIRLRTINNVSDDWCAYLFLFTLAHFKKLSTLPGVFTMASLNISTHPLPSRKSPIKHMRAISMWSGPIIHTSSANRSWYIHCTCLPRA